MLQSPIFKGRAGTIVIPDLRLMKKIWMLDMKENIYHNLLKVLSRIFMMTSLNSPKNRMMLKMQNMPDTERFVFNIKKLLICYCVLEIR